MSKRPDTRWFRVKRTSTRQRRRWVEANRHEVAIHECGHAVVMTGVGWPVVFITLKARGVKNRGATALAFARHDARSMTFGARIAVNFGGIVAQRFGASPLDPGLTVGTDLPEAMEDAEDSARILRLNAVDPDSVPDPITLMLPGIDLACDILRRRWATVVALADLLLIRDELDADAVAAVVGTTWHLFVTPPVTRFCLRGGK